ncbi:MAG TPA: phosphatase PAP2 family protein [Acidimicrobiia bacterium]|jgi:undecaprenyl-diphosphatase
MTKTRSTLWSRRELRGLFVGACATVVLTFAALTVYVTQRASQPRLVNHVDQHLRAYPGAWRYALAEWVRSAGSAPVVVAAALMAALVVWWVWRRSDLALLCVAAPLFAGVAELAIKSVVERGATERSALEGAFGAGFPSGHTAGVTAIAAAVVVCTLELARDRRSSWYALAAAGGFVFAVAVGSVVGGAHRSLDVVGGMLLGIAATLAVFIVVSVQVDVGGRSARSIQSDPQ